MTGTETQVTLREAIRREVGDLYGSGCLGDSEALTIMEIARLLAQDGVTPSVAYLLSGACQGLGGGQRTKIGLALLGVGETRGLSKTLRWDECARLSGGQFRSGDSFRHGKRIDTYLDEITDQLVELADQAGFSFDGFLTIGSPRGLGDQGRVRIEPPLAPQERENLTELVSQPKPPDSAFG